MKTKNNGNGCENWIYLHSYNCLKRAGINTVEELIQRTPEDMMKVRKLGKKFRRDRTKKLMTLDFL